MRQDNVLQFNPAYEAWIAEEETKLRWLIARHPGAERRYVDDTDSRDNLLNQIVAAFPRKRDAAVRRESSIMAEVGSQERIVPLRAPVMPQARSAANPAPGFEPSLPPVNA